MRCLENLDQQQIDPGIKYLYILGNWSEDKIITNLDVC